MRTYIHVHMAEFFFVVLFSTAPLLTMLGSGSSEVIYTCLQHVQLLLARQPDMWSSSYQNFFCRLVCLYMCSICSWKWLGIYPVLSPLPCVLVLLCIHVCVCINLYLCKAHVCVCVCVFLRYNDPPYVKVKKLEVLTEVCNVENAKNIVDELG